MTKSEQIAAAKKFAEYWKYQGYEKGQSPYYDFKAIRICVSFDK